MNEEKGASIMNDLLGLLGKPLGPRGQATLGDIYFESMLTVANTAMIEAMNPNPKSAGKMLITLRKLTETLDLTCKGLVTVALHGEEGLPDFEDTPELYLEAVRISSMAFLERTKEGRMTSADHAALLGQMEELFMKPPASSATPQGDRQP